MQEVTDKYRAPPSPRLSSSMPWPSAFRTAQREDEDTISPPNRHPHASLPFYLTAAKHLTLAPFIPRPDDATIPRCHLNLPRRR